MRTAIESRLRIMKELTANKNRIIRLISIYYPEFTKVFGDWEGKAAMLILGECPTPKKIVENGVDGIVAMGKKHKIRAVGRKRAAKLLETAGSSIGTTEGLVSAENELQMLLEDYENKMRQYDKTMALIESLAKGIPGFEKMLEIKGVGLITAAGFNR